jgi:hypothetical protein
VVVLVVVVVDDDDGDDDDDDDDDDHDDDHDHNDADDDASSLGRPAGVRRSAERGVGAATAGGRVLPTRLGRSSIRHQRQGVRLVMMMMMMVKKRRTIR